MPTKGYTESVELCGIRPLWSDYDGLPHCNVRHYPAEERCDGCPQYDYPRHDENGALVHEGLGCRLTGREFNCHCTPALRLLWEAVAKMQTPGPVADNGPGGED